MSKLLEKNLAALREALKYCGWLSIAQLADQCRIPDPQFKSFARLVKDAVAAGEMEHMQQEGSGFSIPVFRLKERA